MKAQQFNMGWFIAQFGPRPTEKQTWDLDKEISDSQDKTARLQKELLALEKWQIQEDAALKSFVNTVYESKNKPEDYETKHRPS